MCVLLLCFVCLCVGGCVGLHVSNASQDCDLGELLTGGDYTGIGIEVELGSATHKFEVKLKGTQTKVDDADIYFKNVFVYTTKSGELFHIDLDGDHYEIVSSPYRYLYGDTNVNNCYQDADVFFRVWVKTFNSNGDGNVLTTDKLKKITTIAKNEALKEKRGMDANMFFGGDWKRGDGKGEDDVHAVYDLNWAKLYLHTTGSDGAWAEQVNFGIYLSTIFSAIPKDWRPQHFNRYHVTKQIVITWLNHQNRKYIKNLHDKVMKASQQVSSTEQVGFFFLMMHHLLRFFLNKNTDPGRQFDKYFWNNDMLPKTSILSVLDAVTPSQQAEFLALLTPKSICNAISTTKGTGIALNDCLKKQIPLCIKSFVCLSKHQFSMTAFEKFTDKEFINAGQVISGGEVAARGIQLDRSHEAANGIENRIAFVLHIIIFASSYIVQKQYTGEVGGTGVKGPVCGNFDKGVHQAWHNTVIQTYHDLVTDGKEAALNNPVGNAVGHVRVVFESRRGDANVDFHKSEQFKKWSKQTSDILLRKGTSNVKSKVIETVYNSLRPGGVGENESYENICENLQGILHPKWIKPLNDDILTFNLAEDTFVNRAKMTYAKDTIEKAFNTLAETDAKYDFFRRLLESLTQRTTYDYTEDDQLAGEESNE